MSYPALPAFPFCDPSPPSDRRVLAGTSELSGHALVQHKIAFALVVANKDSNNICPGITAAGINEVADTAWKIYYNPLPAGTNNLWPVAGIYVYPNPLRDEFYIDNKIGKEIRLIISDLTGRVLHNRIQKAQLIATGMDQFSSGVYFYRICDEEQILQQGKLIKE